jgi:thioredoxin-like negative regulator of GroEL
MFFQWEQGRWKLAGIDIQPAEMVAAQPAPGRQ